jgi:hypothetical protein
MIMALLPVCLSTTGHKNKIAADGFRGVSRLSAPRAFGLPRGSPGSGQSREQTSAK